MDDEAAEGRSFFSAVLRFVCPYARVIAVLFAMLLVFTVASAVFALALPPDHPSYYPAVLSVVVDGTGLVAFGTLLYSCRRFHRQTV